jgi:hypothetical protein
MPMRSSDNWLTTAEAAEKYGAAQSSMRVWCWQGRFPNAERKGRDWLIPEGDLEGFEARGRGRPPKAARVEPGAEVVTRPRLKAITSRNG